MPRLLRRGVLTVACALLLQLLAVPAEAAGTTVTFTGRVTDYSTGAPVAGACVNVQPAGWGDGPVVASACTGADGRYRIELACCTGGGYTGYSLKAKAAGYPDYWWNELPGWNNNRFQHVMSGDVKTADFALMHQPPRIHGRITDEFGDPAVGAVILLTEVYPGWYSRVFSYGGQYTIENAPPGRLKIALGSEYNAVQTVPGKTTYEEGTWFELGEGSDLTVDEQFLPYGSVELVAVDEVTGAPVEICGELGSVSGSYLNLCTGADGSPAVWPSSFGEFTLSTTPRQRTHWTPATRKVTVEPGKTTRVEIRLERAYALRTRAVVVGDSNRHHRVCAVAVPVEPGRVVLSGGRGSLYPDLFCSRDDGTLEIGPLDTDKIRLFAVPDRVNSVGSPQFGMQWVGASGGTGEEGKAAVIQLTKGAWVQAPNIKLATGAVVEGSALSPTATDVCVLPFAPHPNLDLLLTTRGEYTSPIGGCTSSANPSPTYRVDRLGPYSWPLRFAERVAGTHGVLWSGGAVSRLLANPVKLTPGETARYDVTLRRGGSLHGTFADTASGTAYVHDAYTGDLITSATLTGGEFTASGLGNGPVLVRLSRSGTADCWLRLPLDGTHQRALFPTLGLVTTVALSTEGCAAQPVLYRIPLPRNPGVTKAPARPQGLGR